MELSFIKEITNDNLDLLELIKECPLEIRDRFEYVEFQAGKIVCHQGDIINCLYIITEGYADIYYMVENGKKYSQVIVKKGEIIGEFEIFDQRSLICSVEALTDLKLIKINQQDFITWIKSDNNLCFFLVKYLCNQFYQFSKKAGFDTLYSLKARICWYLLTRSKSVFKNMSSIELKLNKEKLSEEFAVTTRSVNRVLQSLKNKEIIDIKTDSIVVKDLEKLILEEEASRNL